jgi:S1-C subfamily serine protease
VIGPLVFAGGALAALLAVAVYASLNPAPRPLTEVEIRRSVDQVLESQAPDPPFSIAAFDVIRPSFVLIETTRAADSEDGSGRGSGVVVDMAGQILTALHVVADAESIEVIFADGTRAGATIAAQQPENDIAVLQPDRLPGVLVPATLGNPASMRVGSDAYVVGNPLGLYASMSAGVVSGLDRSFQVPGSEQIVSGLIQIDAAVNPGSSGGPLLDRAGRVTGIVTALVNPTGDEVFIGIGFAVPIDVAGGAAGLPRY